MGELGDPTTANQLPDPYRPDPALVDAGGQEVPDAHLRVSGAEGEWIP